MAQEVRVRIAPSPTGEPHVGTAYVGLFNMAFARKHGGKFLLRVEDTDQTRSRKHYAQQIYDAMHWLGLNYDEGPDVGGPYGPYVQSERLGLYKKYVEILLNKDAAYYCFCTAERLDSLREEQEKNKSSQKGYDGHCRAFSKQEALQRVARGEACVIRLKVNKDGETVVHDLLRPNQQPFLNREIDDQVLLKSDGYPTYHLANVVDDYLMKITHVIRAEEWISSTPKHVLLYQAFGWECPKFAHLSLLRNSDGSKISKRKNPTSLLFYRDEGYLPEALLNFLANHSFTFPEVDPKTGEKREIFSVQEMQNTFDFNHVSLGGPVFDLQKLNWMNGEYLRRLNPEELKQRILDNVDEKIDALLPHLQVRMKLLSDIFHQGAFYLGSEMENSLDRFLPKKKTPQETLEMLEKLLKSLEGSKKIPGVVVWEEKCLESVVQEFCGIAEWDCKDVFMCLRGVITGKLASPPLFTCMEMVGRRRSIHRIEEAIQLLKQASQSKKSVEK